MKKIGLLIIVAITMLWSCDSNESYISKDTSVSNKVNARTLGEFYKIYGLQKDTANFNASNQTEITLLKGTKLTIPYGTFTNGTTKYYGTVKIISREFSKVSDMAMSNFQTVDNNGNMLATGGSFELLFLDSNNNKLFLDDNKEINIKFPSKIESNLKDNMNVYDGKFVLGINQNDQLIWTLNKKESVVFNDNKYNYILTSQSYNGPDGTTQRVSCESFLKSNPPNWVAYDECMGIRRLNWDIRFWDKDAVPFEVRIAGEPSPDMTRIMVFPGNQPSVTNLLYDSENNRYTTASTNIENVGAITIAAFSIENGEFRYSIISSNTNVSSITLDLQEGSVEEFHNQLSTITD